MFVRHEQNNNSIGAIRDEVQYLNQNASNSIDDIDHQIDTTCASLRELQDSIVLLTSSVDALDENLTEQQNDVSSTSTAMLERLNIEVLEVVMNSSVVSVTTINTLQDRLANGILNLHIFDSCEAVSTFSIQLLSGMYSIKAENSSIDVYCSTIIVFSCHNVRGRWRRIACLSNNTSPIECPTGF